MPVRQGSAATGLTQNAAPTVRTVVTAAISVSGTAKRIVRAMESTSAVVREMRSPVSPLDRREQAEHAAHEVLPKLGEHLLREYERGAPREPGQHRLREEEQGEDARACRRKPASSRPGRTARDGPAAPVRETRCRRRGVQADHPDERPPVPAREQLGLAPKLGPVGDRKELAHRSLPRVTVSR